MFKRVLFLTLVIIVMIISVACNNSNKITGTESQINEEKTKKLEPFALAREGRIDDIEFGLGAESREIVSKWGEPKDQGSFMGGYYLTYDNVVFFTDGWNSSEGKVLIISVGKGRQLYGTRIGMTPTEIKKILGSPHLEEFVVESDELNGGNWGITYNLGKYSLSFYSKDANSPTESAQLEINKE